MENNQKDTNTWFHHVTGSNLHERKDERFIEYRRKWNEWPETFNIENFPLFLDIEVTSVCNLKCPFCATTISKDKFKKGFISKYHVEKIINEGAENGLYGVKFNMRGEPLLHSLIDYFVKYAKEKNLIDVYFNTNALLLTDSMSNKLIEAGLDRISISFDGHTKEIYEKNRVGSNFEIVLENVKKLQSIKNKLNVKHPRVRVQTIKLPGIDMQKYKELWEPISDEVAYLDYQDMTSRKKGIISNWRCPQIWQRMAILWDGEIFPCNHDRECLIKMGNIDNVSIKDSWKSSNLEFIRRLHYQGSSHIIDACDGCYLRDTEILKTKKGE